MNGSQNNKEINFEINLLPVISLLAVLISFLLATTAWIHIGTLNVSQAIGQETNSNTPNPPTVSAKFLGNGSLQMILNDVKGYPRGLNRVTFKRRGSKLNWKAIASYTDSIHQELPKIQTALILPQASSSYAEIIQLLDQFKKSEIKDVGISPL